MADLEPPASVRILRRPVPEGCLSQNLHPVLNRVYMSRHIKSEEEIGVSLEKLHSCDLLSGMEQAVSLLLTALERQQSVMVIGDFDADGATSTALAVKALRLCGLHRISYKVPDRFKFGYGLTPEIVEEAAKDKPDLIITVDNGISSHAGVDRAKTLGISVLITDHHLPGDSLPDADAIVNPNLQRDGFPSKALAGVGTVFYLMLALRASLRQSGWFVQQGLQEPNMAQLLDLVALGTVADVVPLDRNNRILVAQGLARIRAGRCCKGIKALINISGRQCQSIVASDLGFALGPRLNAAGRMENMSIGIECLLSENDGDAAELSVALDNLNAERREVEAQMKAEALKILDSMTINQNKRLPLGLCLFDAGWHKGVIGILAARIKDRLCRPVIAFARVNSESQQLQGSARSVNGVHIRDVLDAIATRSPHLLQKFGGHAMAAGLTLEQSHYDEFCLEFDREVARKISPEAIQNTLISDGELEPGDISMELAQQIRFAGPWGQEFPEPLFDGEFQLVARRRIGTAHLKLTLCHPRSSKQIEAIAFNLSDENWPETVTKVKLVYHLNINEFRQRKSLQLLVRHAHPVLKKNLTQELEPA